MRLYHLHQAQYDFSRTTRSNQSYRHLIQILFRRQGPQKPKALYFDRFSLKSFSRRQQFEYTHRYF